MNSTPLSRRAVLRGLGTAMTLPFLESLLPSRVFGAISSTAVAQAAASPRRLAWLYVPNGIDMQNWTPATFGTDYELTPTLKTLADYREKMLVISGLVCDKANQNGDGPGDHARAQAAYLTGVQPRKTEGANIHSGTSADQAAAERIGHLTKFSSLEIGLEEGKQVGSCDSGYSCAYSHNLSWRNATTPMVKDCNPQSVFDRLFSNNDPRESAEARARREADNKSVVDYILNNAKGVQKQLASTDKQKLDEYLTAVREIEQRIARAATEPPPVLPPGAVRPASFASSTDTKTGSGSNTSSNKSDYPEHAKLMLDMMVLAFQADLTRVITMPFADEGSNQQYPWADADVPHHGTSHHGGDPAKMALLQKINVFHLQQVAYLLGKLDAIQEGTGSILDNSIIAYGGGISDGDRHNHDVLPLVLLGKGGGTINTGRHLDAKGVPINNLWLSMLDHAGASDDKLGDSTGKLKLT
jgi:hypothetical protein